ncbi:MAG: reductive dehalogenase [Anaerolineales bacterium]
MSEKNLTRRDFIKSLGLASAGLPAIHVVGRIGQDELVRSEEKWGGFLIRRRAANDPPYEIDEEKFERFHERNNMFGRSSWDEGYQADLASVPDDIMQQKQAAGVPGYSVVDDAFKNANWWLARNRGADPYGWVTEPNPVPPQLGDYSTAEITNITKTAALFFGASDVGVAETDEKWFYQTLGRSEDSARPLVFDDVDVPIRGEEGPVVIPKKMNRVIALAYEMDYDAFLPNGISLLVGGSTGQGYSKMAFTTATLADFIRRLGYQAIPMGNDTGLSVPISVDAGLGEQGRLGFLLTPKYGPRVRLSKVLTDMPLDVDSPISFGVREFCENCKLCGTYCPSGCIDVDGEVSYETYDINNMEGVKKWQVNQYYCHKYWKESGAGCINCATVCPFNKPQGWLHDATRIMIGAKSGPLDALMKNLDEFAGYGGQGEDPDPVAVEEFWTNKINKDFIHIKRS